MASPAKGAGARVQADSLQCYSRRPHTIRREWSTVVHYIGVLVLYLYILSLYRKLYCALAAAQCTVIAPVCFVCLCVCGSVTTITRNCVHRSSPNWVWTVSKGSGHLQLITFWPSRAPGKGVCGGVKILDSALPCQRARVVHCLRLLWTRFSLRTCVGRIRDREIESRLGQLSLAIRSWVGQMIYQHDLRRYP